MIRIKDNITRKINLCWLLILPLLCSFKSASTYLPFNTDISSYAAGRTIRACKKVYEGKSTTLELKAKNYNQVAASMTMSMGLYEIGRESVVSTETIPDYIFYYRLDTYLNNNVHYRGGFLDINDLYNPAYLQYIDMDVTFNNLSSENIQNFQFYPSRESDINNSGLQDSEKNYYLIYVDPTASADFSHNDLEDNNYGSYKYDYRTMNNSKYPYPGNGYKANLSVDNISESMNQNKDAMKFEKQYSFPKTSKDGNFMSGPTPPRNHFWTKNLFE